MALTLVRIGDVVAEALVQVSLHLQLELHLVSDSEQGIGLAPQQTASNLHVGAESLLIDEGGHSLGHNDVMSNDLSLILITCSRHL